MKIITESEASRNMARNIPMRREDGLDLENSQTLLSRSSTYRQGSDSQVSKFYRKYGEDWVERFYKNQEGEI